MTSHLTRQDPHRRAVAVVLAKAGVRGVGTLSEHERRIYDAVDRARHRGRALALQHSARPTI